MFKIPVSVIEAEQRLDSVIIDIEKIQLQLSYVKAEAERNGGALSAERHDWRSSAVRALSLKVEEARRLRSWLGEHPSMKDAQRGLLVARRLLKKALAIILTFEPGDLTEQERADVARMREYVVNVESKTAVAKTA